jgi:hypothetical protein
MTDRYGKTWPPVAPHEIETLPRQVVCTRRKRR